MPEDIIRVKDKRKGVFVVDNLVLNGYGKALGTTGIALYVVLCRYANRETQQSYPSLTLIRNETGMDRRTIIKTADRLEKLRLIKRKKVPGKYTIYTLLEPNKITSSKNATTLTSSKITQGSSKIPYTSSKSRTERMKKTNEENGIKGLESLKETMKNLGLN